MKPLRIALIHADNPHQYTRAVGFWSYEVPEFEVHHCGTKRDFTMRRSQFEGYDIILREDHACYGEIINDADIPLCYYVVDTPAMIEKYRLRCKVAVGCDLILVEQDRLERFEHLGAEVRRFGYCINDRLYYDYGMEKSIDIINYYIRRDQPRNELNLWLLKFCRERGYSYQSGKRLRMDYPHGMNQARITINLSYNENCRPHRIFDAMGTRSCVVTSTLPDVSGEYRKAGLHYEEFGFIDWAGLAETIEHLLESGRWETIANDAHEMVMKHHTWSVRAKELRETFNEVFGI